MPQVQPEAKDHASEILDRILNCCDNFPPRIINIDGRESALINKKADLTRDWLFLL
jgi:hypothetical protein